MKSNRSIGWNKNKLFSETHSDCSCLSSNRFSLNPILARLTQRRKKEKAKKKELNELFNVAMKQPEVPVGVDPNLIVCEHFKVGQCAKGFEFKFSHDLNMQRKGKKIDIYSDRRGNGTIEGWDQESLMKLVESKSKEYNKNKPTVY